MFFEVKIEQVNVSMIFLEVEMHELRRASYM